MDEELRDDTSAQRALSMVLEERKYQKERWTQERDEGHTKEHWLNILVIWVGKAAQITQPYRGVEDRSTLIEFRKRMVQVAAIALAAVERLNDKIG